MAPPCSRRPVEPLCTDDSCNQPARNRARGREPQEVGRFQTPCLITPPSSAPSSSRSSCRGRQMTCVSSARPLQRSVMTSCFTAFRDLLDTKAAAGLALHRASRRPRCSWSSRKWNNATTPCSASSGTASASPRSPASTGQPPDAAHVDVPLPRMRARWPRKAILQAVQIAVSLEEQICEPGRRPLGRPRGDAPRLGPCPGVDW